MFFSMILLRLSGVRMQEKDLYMGVIMSDNKV